MRFQVDNLFQSLVPLPGLGYCEKNLDSPGSQIFLILQPPWSSGPCRRCASPALRPCSVPGFLPKEFPNRAASIPSPTFSGETRWACLRGSLLPPGRLCNLPLSTQATWRNSTLFKIHFFFFSIKVMQPCYEIIFIKNNQNIKKRKIVTDITQRDNHLLFRWMPNNLSLWNMLHFLKELGQDCMFCFPPPWISDAQNWMNS